MLLVGKDLASYTLAAGEPFVLEVQLLDSAGRGIDLDDQAMVLTFYTAGTRAVVADFAGNPSQYEGERLSDTTGEYFRWAFDGRWSDAMLNKPGLRVELAQRLFYGRRIISTGTLSVTNSAAAVPSLPGGSIALTAVRVTIKDNAVIGGAPVITQTVILYDGPSVPVAAPVFTTPTSVASDGTPQVGELLTGIDGVATNAASYTRRWLLGSTVLTSSATYMPTEVGSYRYETIATGPGGETTSGSNITVAAASPVLNALTISPSTATVGTSTTITISGATDGSVITGTVPAGMTLNSAARTITGTPTTAGSPSIVLTETLAGATGSPRQSTVSVTIAAAPVTPALGALTVSPSSATVSTAYSGTINGLTSGSSIALSGAGAAGLSIAGGVITGTPTTAGAVNIIETLAGATGSPRTSSGVVTVAAATIVPLTVLFIGSSTPAKYFTDGTGPSNSSVTKSSDGTSFTAVGTTGAGGTNFGDQLQKATGKPVRFLTFGLPGSQLAEWDGTTFAQRTAAINAGIAAGGVDLIVCGVGFNDAYQSDGVVSSQASHQAKLTSLFSRMRTGLNQPNVPVFIMGSQKYTGTATSKPNDMYTWVRAAEIAAADSAPNYWYAHSYDLAQLSDGIHQTNGSYLIHATRGASNVIRFLAGQAVERGPRVTGLTAVYNTATDVTLTHSSGSDFTPTSAITGFELSFDNFSTIASVSAAVRQSGSAVRLTHAASGGVAPAVRAIYGANPVTTASLHDNSTQVLPINPTLVPVVASAGSNVNDPSISSPTISGTPSAATVGQPYNYTPTVASGTSPYTFAQTGTALPAGLSFSTSTGAITGTPTTAATTSGIVITVTDAAARTASQTVSIVVSAASAGFTDEFNYTNGSTLAANGWTSPSGTMTVQDGEVYGSVIGNSLAPYTPVSGNQGATVPIRQKTIATGNTLILLHYQDDSNYVWGGFVGTDRWQIGKTLAGTAGQIATGTVPATAAGTTNVVDFATAMASDGLSMALSLTIDGAVVYSGITVSDAALLPKGQMGLRQSAAAATATTKTAFTRFVGRSS